MKAMAASLPAVFAAFLLLTLAQGSAAKVCNNGGMGREAAMLKLLGRYDDATLDYATRVSTDRLAPIVPKTPQIEAATIGVVSSRKLLGERSGQGSTTSSPETFLRPFSLRDVRLLKGSQFERAQQTNLEYLLYLDIDRLVWRYTT